MYRRIILALCAATLLTGSDFDWNLPQGFPRPAVPAGNPMSAAKVELGRYLFYDTRLSINNRQSCATCHRQELAFTDGRAQAIGTTGEPHTRSSMSLVNVAYAPALTWTSSALASLEEQALVPMFGEHPIELGLKGHEAELLAALRLEPVYQRLFPLAFSAEPDPLTVANTAKAIAAFERSIVSMRSPYDRSRWGGETAAISAAAKRGEIIFSSNEQGRCFRCHGGWNFSGNVNFEGGEKQRAAFFNTGLTENSVTFRVPSLRNIAVTAPYFHDGRAPTLDDVITHYAAGGGVLRPLALTADDRRDLIEFLKSLTDEELVHDARWSNPWPGKH